MDDKNLVNESDWFENALRYMRGDPALTDSDMKGTECEAFIKFWDSESYNFRSVIKSVFLSAPYMTIRDTNTSASDGTT